MSDETTTLRDTFAAAALTGMLRKLRPGSVFDLTITARQAFEIADAMLRERARNGAPAACETVQPVLCAVQFHGEPLDPECVFATASAADEYQRCTRSPSRVVRLYGDPPQPTLTDAEREAVEWAIEVDESLAQCSGAGTGGEPSRHAVALRALLARLGGDA